MTPSEEAEEAMEILGLVCPYAANRLITLFMVEVARRLVDIEDAQREIIEARKEAK